MSELKHMHAKTECLPFNTEDVRLIITERYGKQEIRMHGEDARFIVEAIAAAKRRTQPEATKPAQDLGAAILALPEDEILQAFANAVSNERDGAKSCYVTTEEVVAFVKYHLAPLVSASPADALVAGDRVDAERWRFRQKFLMDGGAVLWSQRGCQYRNAQGAIICQGGTEEEAIDAAIQAQKDGHG